MNNELTLEKLGRQFEIAKECMTSNLETVRNPNYPLHAKWIHHPTMVRWLHGSSQEFFQDFGKKALSFSGPGESLVLKRKYDLIYLRDLLRQEITQRYSDNVEIMEALRE